MDSRIMPFRGVLYNPRKIKELTPVVSPPYDIIPPTLQADLYARHPWNIVRLELGKESPRDTERNNRYTRAARLYRAWRERGVLKRDLRPAVYPLEVTYRAPGGEERVLRGIIAAVRLEEFGAGVLPHENTLAKPKADRLQLMRACAANFSQIFSLYADPRRTVTRLVERALKGKLPACEAVDPDGARHRLWRIADPRALRLIARALERRPLFIADGHHRYETALAYREEQRKTLKAGGEERKGGEGPGRRNAHEYVMMFLANLEEEGLTVLPIHRLVFGLPGFEAKRVVRRLGREFLLDRFPFSSLNEPAVRQRFLLELQRRGRRGHAFGTAIHGERAYVILTLKDRTLIDRDGAVGHSRAYRRLDVSILQRLVLERALGITPEQIRQQERIAFTKSAREALESVAKGEAQMALLLNPTKVREVKAVARAHEKMPQKSTYFYPKLLTGLVINPLES